MRRLLLLVCAVAAGIAGVALAPAQVAARSQVQVLYDRAWDQYEAGDYDQALAAFNQVIALDPKFAKAYSGRGSVYAAQNDLSHALADYNKAIEIDPSYAGAYVKRGAYYDRKGDHKRAARDFDQAIAESTKAIARNPTESEPYVARGAAYHHKGDYNRALSDCTQAISLKPSDASLYVFRADCYSHQNEYDKALTDFNTAIKLKPKDAFAYVGRGYAYEVTGESDRAIADYQKAISLNSKEAEAYTGLARISLQKKDYELAIADFTAALSLSPKDAYTYSYRGYAYLKNRDYDNAITDYSEAIKLDPKTASSYVNRAFSYEQEGELILAIADYRKAIELEPDNQYAYKHLTGLYEDDRNWTEAVRVYREFAQAHPSRLSHRYLLLAQARSVKHSIFGFTLLYQRKNALDWRPAFGFASTYQHGVLVWGFMLLVPPYLAWQLIRLFSRARSEHNRLMWWALALWPLFALLSVPHRYSLGSRDYYAALSVWGLLVLSWLVLGLQRVVLPAARIEEKPETLPEQAPQEYEPPSSPPPPVWPTNSDPIELCRMAAMTEADIVRAHLNQAGIPSLLNTYGVLTSQLIHGVDGMPTDYAVIRVPQERLEEARQLLAELKSSSIIWPEGMEPEEEGA